MAEKVAGELYESITGQLFEIGRQLRQKGGYPFDPKLLQKYLQNGIEGKFFFGGEPKSFFTKPFDPAEFIGEGWAVWRGPIDGNGLVGEEDMDKRSLLLTEIDVASLSFETCLERGEQRILVEEKLKRLKAATNLVRLGGNVFLGLWRDYEINKRNSVLEYLYRTKKIDYLDFPGFVLRGPDSNRYVPYFTRIDDDKWDWYYGQLDNHCEIDDWSAVLANAA